MHKRSLWLILFIKSKIESVMLPSWCYSIKLKINSRDARNSTNRPVKKIISAMFSSLLTSLKSPLFIAIKEIMQLAININIARAAHSSIKLPSVNFIFFIVVKTKKQIPSKLADVFKIWEVRPVLSRFPWLWFEFIGDFQLQTKLPILCSFYKLFIFLLYTLISLLKSYNLNLKCYSLNFI